MVQVEKPVKMRKAKKGATSSRMDSTASEHKATAGVVPETWEEQDERLWQEQFRDSLDVLSTLADKALADYEAGRTTKITA